MGSAVRNRIARGRLTLLPACARLYENCLTANAGHPFDHPARGLGPCRGLGWRLAYKLADFKPLHPPDTKSLDYPLEAGDRESMEEEAPLVASQDVVNESNR